MNAFAARLYSERKVATVCFVAAPFFLVETGSFVTLGPLKETITVAVLVGMMGERRREGINPKCRAKCSVCYLVVRSQASCCYSRVM